MKPVLIIQNSGSGLKLNENASSVKQRKYVMTGPFTEFDIFNRNERMYTAPEFMPHVNEMLKKKEWGVIYGEYDHPDVFDVSMKYVSHIVENAWYNKEQNTVDGEIRLLNTHYGKDAQALVDDGVPIFVSSRAAGITESNGNVKLKQLFTYDIVADPGFSSAKMKIKTLNESLGFGKENSLGIIEADASKLSLLSEAYNRASQISDYRVFDLGDEEKTEELFNMNKNDLITKKQFKDYTKHLVSELNKSNLEIKKLVKESKVEARTKDGYTLEQMVEYNEALKERMDKMVKYMDYLADKVEISLTSYNVLEKKTENIVEFSNYLAENLDENISKHKLLTERVNQAVEYSEYIAENLDKNIAFSNYIVEQVDNIIDYSEYISENLSKSIKYTNYLAENIERAIDYSEYIVENLESNIRYTEYVAENLDATIGYSEMLAENLDANIGYTEYIVENLSSTIEYSDYLAECVDKTMDFSNSIVESLNNSGSISESKVVKKFKTANEFLAEGCKTGKKVKEEEEETCDIDTKEEEEVNKDKSKKSTPKTKVKEEEEEVDSDEKKKVKKIIKDETSNESLDAKLDNLIAEAKKREASKVEKPNFYEFLNPSDIETFENLSNDTQEEIKVAINESTGYYTRRDILGIMKQVLEQDKVSDEVLLVQSMPSEVKQIWESMNVKDKNAVLAQSKLYNISTPELRENFWSTRKMNKYVLTEGKTVIASENPFEKMNTLSEEQIQSITEKFKTL